VSSLLQAACCCNQCINCACLPSSVTIDCPSFVADNIGEDCSGCGGGGTYNPTIPATTVTAYLCCVNPTGDSSMPAIAIYRANAIKVEDLTQCCTVDGEGVCTEFDLWILFYVLGFCVDVGSGPVFMGWSVGAEFVQASNPCDPCATLTPRDFSSSPCAGFTTLLTARDSWFTCVSTCPPTTSCTTSFAVSIINTPSGSDDPCDPTGTYAVTFPDPFQTGNIVVS
jgi:hypothetical protein